MWCTPMRPRSPAYASALAYTTPTSSAPTSPGPWVTATASTALHPTPASASARSTTAGSAARWARLASSGTTPPKILWTSWDRITRLASSGRAGLPTSTAADVSSQEVSMPSTTSATADPAFERDGVGPGAGDDPRRRGHGEARVPVRARLPDQMRHHAQAVPRERVHLRFGTAHRHRHALLGELEPREPGCRSGDRHLVDRALDDGRDLTRDPDLPRRDAHHPQRRRVDRDGAEERSADARDRHRHGRDRVEPGEALLGSHEVRHARHEGQPAQHVARLRFDADERDDFHVLAGDRVEEHVDVPRRDLCDLHVRALGELHVGGLEVNAPHRGGEGVGNRLAD